MRNGRKLQGKHKWADDIKTDKWTGIIWRTAGKSGGLRCTKLLVTFNEQTTVVVASDSRIRQVLSSKLGRDTDNPEGFGDLIPPPKHCTD